MVYVRAWYIGASDAFVSFAYTAVCLVFFLRTWRGASYSATSRQQFYPSELCACLPHTFIFLCTETQAPFGRLSRTSPREAVLTFPNERGFYLVCLLCAPISVAVCCVCCPVNYKYYTISCLVSYVCVAFGLLCVRVLCVFFFHCAGTKYKFIAK